MDSHSLRTSCCLLSLLGAVLLAGCQAMEQAKEALESLRGREPERSNSKATPNLGSPAPPTDPEQGSGSDSKSHQGESSESSLRVEMTRIGSSEWLRQVSSGGLPRYGSHFYDPVGRSLVVARSKGSRIAFTVNGEEGPAFSSITPPVFSPDGSRIAYVGRTPEATHVIVNGKALATHTGQVPIPVSAQVRSNAAYEIGPERQNKPPRGEAAYLVFSADSRHVAYLLGNGDKSAATTVVLDGKPIETTNGWIRAFGFGPKGQLVYAVQERGETKSGAWRVGGKKGPEASVGPIRFSRDGTRFAYAVWKSGGTRLTSGQGPDDWGTGLGPGGGYYVDHKLELDLNQPPYSSFAFLTVFPGPNLQRLAVVARRRTAEAGEELFVDGRSIGTVVPGRGLRVVVGPGAGLIYHRASDKRVVVNGMVHRDYHSIQRAVFSSSGKRVLYYVTTTASRDVFAVDEQGTEFGPLRGSRITLFSDDEKHHALVEARSRLFLDGEPLFGGHAVAYIHGIRFGASSRRLYVDATRSPRPAHLELAVKRARARGVDLVWVARPQGSKSTSKDGNHSASIDRITKDNKKRHRLVFDGKPTTELFDEMPRAFRFDGDGVLRFIGFREGGVFRVAVAPRK